MDCFVRPILQSSRFCRHVSHVGQIDQIGQIDHDLDHLDPNLPLRYVVQDHLYRYISNPGNGSYDNHAEYTPPTLSLIHI